MKVVFKAFLPVLVFIMIVGSHVSYGQTESSQPLNLANAFAVDTQREARNILESLDLNSAQKSEIQSILLAAMQSMDAVNAQLSELQSDRERMLSRDVQEMVNALLRQRVQLAEMLSVEILSVLSPRQRSQLKLTPETDVEPVNKPTQKGSAREYET